MKKRVVVYTDDGGEETLLLPAVYEVCWRCRGRGVHDCWEGGMTSDEMAEQGPEFFEDYMDGVYDKKCTICRGANVTLEIDREQCSPTDLAKYDQHLASEAEYAAMVEAERRMGC